jgi:pyruvate/2-oxoglutarate dehydrogenase complex dihydrolipoamide dehydrogenase (E3) component
MRSDVIGAHDIVVIGGGPAGVTAALRARELGAAVALVERGPLGGTCTNDGCLPTRVLARAARLARDGRQLANLRLIDVPPQVDFARLMVHAQEMVYAVHEKKQLLHHLRDAGVEVKAKGRSGTTPAGALALSPGPSDISRPAMRASSRPDSTVNLSLMNGW